MTISIDAENIQTNPNPFIINHLGIEDYKTLSLLDKACPQKKLQLMLYLTV